MRSGCADEQSIMAKIKCWLQSAVGRGRTLRPMPSPRPIVLFCGGLAGDGVARNTVHLANGLARRGAPVQVICLSGGALVDDLQGPKLTCLGRVDGPRGVALAAAVPNLRRRLVSMAPSVVMSMGNHAHLAVWAALRGLPDTPRIYRISNDPDRHDHPTRGGLREAGLRLVAQEATRLVCVSAAVAARAPFRRARRDRRVHILPNGVDVQVVRARASEPVRHPWSTFAPRRSSGLPAGPSAPPRRNTNWTTFWSPPVSTPSPARCSL
ncbi:MAG: glycosyltransferase [Phenylobacterium sp.]|nr:glycosyltransferase [Phenylobacterium sp.]